MKTGERAGGAAATRRLVLAAAGMWLLPRVARGQAKRRRIATLAQGTRTATAWPDRRTALAVTGLVALVRRAARPSRRSTAWAETSKSLALVAWVGTWRAG